MLFCLNYVALHLSSQSSFKLPSRITKMMSFFPFLVTVIFCIGLSDSLEKYRCDYKYVSEIDAWLKFQEIPADWNEARLRCQLEGGNMASPTTVALKQAMMDLLKVNKKYLIDSAVHTGIHALFSNRDYFSIEGVPLNAIPHDWNFRESKEYNNTNKNCLKMDCDGKLAETDCTVPNHYICYKKLKNDDYLTACGTIDRDYQLDTRTGSCYKFHKTPRTWSRAFMTCAAEGGYLVIINSETEAQVIREVYGKNPDNSFVGYPVYLKKEFAFIGFHGWSEHGVWLTIHGQTLKEAGYNTFDPGEPNNVTPGEFCGSVTRQGLYNDLRCEDLYPFICEKSPDSLKCGDENDDKKILK